MNNIQVLVAALGAAALVVVVLAEVEDDVDTALGLGAAIGKCMKDVDLSQDEMDLMLDRSYAKTDKEKKMVLCVFRAVKILDEGNKYSKDAVLAAWHDVKVTPGAVKFIQDMAEFCENEVDGNTGEEVAEALYGCFQEQLAKAMRSADWIVSTTPGE